MKKSIFSTLLVVLAVSVHAQPVLKNLSLADPDKDILYIGVENQLAIEGVADKNDLEVVVKERTFEKFRDRFSVTVHTPGSVDVQVYRKAKGGRQLLFSKTYKAELLGYLEARLLGAKDSVLSTGYIITNPQVEVFIPNSQFKVVFHVASFALEITNGNGEMVLAQTHASGNRLSEVMLTQVKDLKSGDKLLFSDIRGNTPDGRTIQLRPFTVYVK
jgi:hypothetical protein